MATRTQEEVERLVGIMARLRAENGCPWDREQDLRSLRPYLVEECFEVLDEMDQVSYGGAWKPYAEELGDLLFQIVFHAQIASELGEFTLADVAQAISDKIVRRHPHVFGELKVQGAEQVLANWAQLKAEERKEKTGRHGSVLDGVPKAAPSLLRAERMTEKASRIGFDWPDLASVREKLNEELGELDRAIAGGRREEIEHELGDVLFTVCNLSRFCGAPPEDALRQAIRRFVHRFHQVEHGLSEQGIPFGKATLEQMEAHWQKAKAKEANLPAPRELPRAEVAGLTVATSELEPLRRFWSEAGAAIGFALRPAPVGELRLSSGAFEIRYRQGPATAAPTVRLSAASKAQCEAAAQALRGVNASVQPTERGFAFADPSGLRWSYELGA